MKLVNGQVAGKNHQHNGEHQGELRRLREQSGCQAHHDINRGYFDATTKKWRNDLVNNMMHFFKMQLFWAALPGDIGSA
jgi:hypothetical protein